MKATVADYRYRLLCMRIVLSSGAIIRFTEYVTDLLISGNLYFSTTGHKFTDYSSNSDFSPSVIDLEGILSLSGISRAAVGSGLFDGARCYVFATNWRTPLEDEEPITAGIFGRAELLDDRYVISGVSLIDALNQSVGDTYGAQCPKTFGGQEYGGCMVSLAANTVTGTLTAVTSASIFRDAARGEAADTFGAGTIQFTSGPNAGTKPLEIKSYAANGTIETFETFYYLPIAGNAYTMIRGCRKRLTDCQNRLGGSNVANFGGFPWIPTSSTYGKFGQGG